jgi:stage V sporulation protein B
LSIQKKIAKNAVYNFLTKAIALAFAFIASVVVARFLGPEKYGVYSFVIWLLYMVGLFANLGIPPTITKYVSEYWGKKDFSAISSVLGRLWRIELVAGVAVSLILFFLAPFIAQWYNNPDLSLYLKVASLVILPLCLMWFYNGLFCGLQRFDLIALINLIVSPLTLLLILLVLHLGGKIEWLLGVTVATNVMLIASYLYFKKTQFVFPASGPSEPGFGGKLLKFSASMFVMLILEAMVWERFGILFLSIFSTSSEISFYNVAFILSSRSMILLPGALTGILLPAMSEVYGGGDKEELARVYVNSTRHLAMLSFPLCLGGIAISGELFPILYGTSFQPASFPFIILLVGGTIGSVATASSSLLYGAELQRIVVRVGLLSTFINLLAGRLLVPGLGAMGAALATAFAQIVGGSAMINYGYKKFMQQRFPWISILRIFLASALMGGVAFFLSAGVKGIPGLAFALIVSLPLYTVGLFLSRSLTSGDMELVEASLNRIPPTWGRVLKPIFARLIQLFYPSLKGTNQKFG